MSTKKKTAEREESLATLHRWIKPGDTVFTILRHVSDSGMTRRIDVVAFHKGEPLFLSYHVARALGLRLDDRKAGVYISGCGMDMGFELVYQLGAALWPGGDGKTITSRNGTTSVEKDGGYLLKQRWL